MSRKARNKQQPAWSQGEPPNNLKVEKEEKNKNKKSCTGDEKASGCRTYAVS